jgi:outer membrane receptor for ferrienterochelin and colicins
MKNFFNIFLFLILFWLGGSFGFSQSLSGTVFELDAQKNKTPLTGVNVHWSGTMIVATTDNEGHFKISHTNRKDTNLIVSFVGYKSDTMVVRKDEKKMEILLNVKKDLKEVVIEGRQSGTYISRIDVQKTDVISKEGLQKAACCNLSESFENSASVDVSYQDAVSGAKQIQLLGLSGVYSQIQTENIPAVHGLASSFGLNYIPGSWMESIQIAKGTASVINGYESITGQINVEYKKPETAEKFFVNLYANSNQRLEVNMSSAYKLNDKWSTMLLLHGSDLSKKADLNKDSFLDIPTSNLFSVFNRWDYIKKGRRVSRSGIKYLQENRNGGTMNYNKDTFVNDTAAINAGTQPYGVEIKTKRMEVFSKNGFLFPDKPYKSVGLILSGVNHEQEGLYGINTYTGHESTFYANLLYQSIFGNTNHKYTTGLSYMLDDYDEKYKQTMFVYNYQVTGDTSAAGLFTVHHSTDTTYNFNRTESVPGAFFEYTYTYADVLTVIAGMRADYHNEYGFFYTPRLHIRVHINKSTTLRASAGKGYRSANVIAENLSILASQRKLFFSEKLKQEEAWNFGINLTKDFTLFKRKAQFDIDAYRTQFVNQVIVDMDSVPAAVYIYNLNGESYSNCYQAQLTYEPVDRFSILLAYRINDVKTTINNQLRERPFVNRYKGLINVAYATKFDKWKFDLTGQFNGSARIPDQQKMPVKLQRPEHSPPFFILIGQITKKFKHFDVYLGGENLTNFTQKDPITEYLRPYHTHFDTSMIWGPIVGRTIYAGFRYMIK